MTQMKLLNKKLRYKILNNVYDKVVEHAPHDNPVRRQIEKNLGWWWNGDGLIRLKVRSPQSNIGNDLDETT